MSVAILEPGGGPIAAQVVRALRHAIVTMRLRPGEMLSEQEIAGRFGVSRSPVREAFIKLSEVGLVRVLPQRGTRVAPISYAAVEDARFVREAVETAIVREASARGLAPRGALADNLARQRAAARARDGEAFFALDEEFHRLLAEAAGRASAFKVIEDVKAQMDRVRYLATPGATPMGVLVDQHAAIADAVAAADPDRAAAGMRAHLSEILQSLPALALAHPDLFEAVPAGLAPAGSPALEAATP
jgi:DNA-binding GntR family transcriptional regulator